MEDAGEIRHTNNQYVAISKNVAGNMRHQSETQAQLSRSIDQVEAVGEPHSLSNDDTDDGDDSDDADFTADEIFSSGTSDALEPVALPIDVPLQQRSVFPDHINEAEDGQQGEDHREVGVISVINRHHGHQSQTPPPQETRQVEDHSDDGALDTTDEVYEKEKTGSSLLSKRQCPHHPHARWVRFDPSGQAWCDKMDCWDCCRLMKIGEVLGYQHLSEPASIVTIDHGIEAWASFVISQKSLVVLMATQQALALCKALGIEVPDLSGEVHRLVAVW